MIERLDPRTGEGLNALGSELSSVGWAHAATVRDDFVEVFDLQTLERVGGPIAIGDVVAASAFDDRVVGLGRDAMIRLYGSTGDELSSLQITVDRPEQFDVTNSVGTDVARHGRPGRSSGIRWPATGSRRCGGRDPCR